MTSRDALLSLLVAVAAGGLIGAEREQAQRAKRAGEFGGIRTFPLVALLGATGALLRPIAGVWVVGVGFAALALLLAASYVRSRDGDVGISTEIAALLTYVLGAVAATPELGHDRHLVVVVCSGITMLLLALKAPLHRFAAKISRDDVYATTRFVLLALVVLPVLPNRTYGPLDVINPFNIGLMIVLVAGLSFAGYVAARVTSAEKGLLVTGLLGGLVSSTAVTLTFAGRAKEDRATAPLCAVAIVAASATMFPRVLVTLSIADASLLPTVAIPLAIMTLAAYAFAWLLYRKTARAELADPVPFHNPFELRRAVQFGLLYGLVIFVAKGAQTYFGTRGVLASSVLAGLTDVDAITLSLAALHRGGLEASVASAGILAAAATNTVVKAVLAVAIGGKALGRRVAPALLVALVLGMAGFGLIVVVM